MISKVIFSPRVSSVRTYVVQIAFCKPEEGKHDIRMYVCTYVCTYVQYVGIIKE